MGTKCRAKIVNIGLKTGSSVDETTSDHFSFFPLSYNMLCTEDVCDWSTTRLNVTTLASRRQKYLSVKLLFIIYYSCLLALRCYAAIHHQSGLRPHQTAASLTVHRKQVCPDGPRNLGCFYQQTRRDCMQAQ